VLALSPEETIQMWARQDRAGKVFLEDVIGS
jgi:hypothetical protein